MKPKHPAKYISPFTDFGFKKLFGEEANKHLLIDFLNQLLPPHHQIYDLKITEYSGSRKLDYKGIFDLYCESQDGHKFIVELQMLRHNFFRERTVFYATFPIREQAERGEWDYQLKPVYCIALLNFTFNTPKNSEYCLQHIQLCNEVCEVFHDKLTFIFVEMPRFKKTLDELKTHFDKWLYFIKHLENFGSIPAELSESIFEQAFSVAEIARLDPQQQESYEHSLKYYRDLKNVIDTARLTGEKRGFEEGIEIGKKLGIELGKELISRKQGIEIGKEREKLRLIELMLQQGILPPEKIAELLNVDKEFVVNLKKELQ